MNLSNEKIDNAIRHLIVIASQYPDDALAKAIDDVRLIIHRQQTCIEQMEKIIRKEN